MARVPFTLASSSRGGARLAANVAILASRRTPGSRASPPEVADEPPSPSRLARVFLPTFATSREFVGGRAKGVDEPAISSGIDGGSVASVRERSALLAYAARCVLVPVAIPFALFGFPAAAHAEGWRVGVSVSMEAAAGGAYASIRRTHSGAGSSATVVEASMPAGVHTRAAGARMRTPTFPFLVVILAFQQSACTASPPAGGACASGGGECFLGGHECRVTAPDSVQDCNPNQNAGGRGEVLAGPDGIARSLRRPDAKAEGAPSEAP